MPWPPNYKLIPAYVIQSFTDLMAPDLAVKWILHTWPLFSQTCNLFLSVLIHHFNPSFMLKVSKKRKEMLLRNVIWPVYFTQQTHWNAFSGEEGEELIFNHMWCGNSEVSRGDCFSDSEWKFCVSATVSHPTRSLHWTHTVRAPSLSHRRTHTSVNVLFFFLCMPRRALIQVTEKRSRMWWCGGAEGRWALVVLHQILVLKLWFGLDFQI